MFVRPLSLLTFFLIVVYFVVALIVPEMSFWTAGEFMFAPLYQDIPIFIFNGMNEHSGVVRSMNTDDYNIVQHSLWMLWWVATIGLTLVLPLLWWVFITFWLWLSVYNVFPKFAIGAVGILGGSDSPEAENWGHLVMGRTTIQDTYDAEVQANAIVSALNKQNNK